MVARSFPILALPVFISAAAAAPAPEPARQGPSVRVAQVRVQQRIVIRVPRLPPRAPVTAAAARAPLPPVRWIEKKTDRCVPLDTLAGAAISQPNAVDLVLSEGRWVRAKLSDECPALDFYSGLYLRPTADGKVCAARDSFRSRSGGECRIEAFRTLIPTR